MLRQLKLQDWKIYKEIRLECLKNTPWAFGTRHVDEVLKEDKYWQDTISNPHRIIFGIFDNDKIMAMAGFALPDKMSSYNDSMMIQTKINGISADSDKYFIVSVYSKLAYRGLGNVESLLRYIINYHQQYYTGVLCLSVEVNNTPAICLYKKLGFVIVDKLPSRIMGDDLLHEEYLMELQCLNWYLH